MRITGAYSVVETLAQHKKLTFHQAFMYIHNNLKSFVKYQKIAYQVIRDDSGLFEQLCKEQSI